MGYQNGRTTDETGCIYLNIYIFRIGLYCIEEEEEVGRETLYSNERILFYSGYL